MAPALGGILALDQSSKCTGWAYSDYHAGGNNPHAPVWGHHKFIGLDGAGKIGAAFDIFLRARIAVFGPQYIVYETPYVGGGKIPMNPQTVRMLCGLAHQIDVIAEQCGVECREVGTLAFTKFFTGQGKYPTRQAKKRATMERCKLLGWAANEDEADALALLCYAESVLRPQFRRPHPPDGLFPAAEPLAARMPP